ncbi:MAG TPA: hypothetical protein VGL95_14735 [Acetobacteraceae bacterium]|jgi:predicted RNase H-like nuclease (RuvC/YqgF family)
MSVIGENFKAALRECGPIGHEALARLQSLHEAMRDELGLRQQAERQVRDMAREIERLKRELAEARSKP